MVRSMLGVEVEAAPIFGWRAGVPLASGRVDRTEVDMKWGSLLVEAKLTESDFQTCSPLLIAGYRDLENVFDLDLLPRASIAIGRRKPSVEFPEDYTQEEIRVPVEEWQPHVWEMPPESINGYASYQLIRNVLAAHANQASFCVLLDQRRPDLRETWYQVMAAALDAALRVRLKVLTWQELVPVLPEDLGLYLAQKYGIVPPGAPPWPIEETVVDNRSYSSGMS